MPATRPPLNPAGFVIHSAGHAARPDAHAVMHLHTHDGQAVSAQAFTAQAGEVGLSLVGRDPLWPALLRKLDLDPSYRD